jgi:metallo-beta-lactamase family protein
MEVIKNNTKIKLNEYIEVEFIDSGHCFGGSMIKIWIKKPNQSVFHCIYTSDMGSEYNKIIHPMSKYREQISKCNLLISEATYNDSSRSFQKSDVIKEFEEFKALIKKSLLENKRVLLPVFSFSKTQEFMCLLYEWLKDEEWAKDIPIFLDGVLMHKITGVYQRTLEDDYSDYFKQVCNYSNFKVNKTFDGTMAILSQRTVGIYLSSSGFCQQGRVVTYLKQFLNCSKDVIIFTGYIGGEGSIGWKIANSSQKTVSIEKSVIFKRAEVYQFHCFSGHIQYEELVSLFKGVNCSNILIHHSSHENKQQFVDDVRKELQDIGKTTKIQMVDSKNNQFVF